MIHKQEKNDGMKFQQSMPFLGIENVDDGRHCMAYVRASKYINGSYNNSALSTDIDMENMWYKLNDHNLELVPFSELLKAPERSLLIYEQP